MATAVCPSKSAVKKSARCQVELIPWDPDAPEHVERMRQQRIVCGWKEDRVQTWQQLQREGKITLQWVAFTEIDPDREKKLQEHVAAYPLESDPIEDTAASLGGKLLSPSRRKFIPVGHISLDTQYETVDHHEDVPGLYWIATFYISKILQGYGLGRAAMDAVEMTAISEPLNAKTLALSTVAKEYDGKTEKWNAMGRKAPELSLQDWYGRRGYEVYKRVDAMWYDVDPTGKKWPCTAVFMRKAIKS